MAFKNMNKNKLRRRKLRVITVQMEKAGVIDFTSFLDYWKKRQEKL